MINREVPIEDREHFESPKGRGSKISVSGFFLKGSFFSFSNLADNMLDVSDGQPRNQAVVLAICGHRQHLLLQYPHLQHTKLNLARPQISVL